MKYSGRLVLNLDELTLHKVSIDDGLDFADVVSMN